MSLAVVHRNEVTLVGRLSAAAVERTLPSGDVVVSWRVVVQRPPEPTRTTIAVDTIDCVARSAALGRRALSWLPGDTMEMTGALRRRFWRAGDGVRSRYEVEVATARKVARAGGNGGGQSSSA
jgi:single-strand DNA-binding protein